MKRFLFNVLTLLLSMFVVGSAPAAQPSWNPADAVNDAEKDIKAQRVQFYWSGSIAEFPVGVPFDFAKQYPKADAGVGCVTNDIPLREKQEKYARLYNEKMYDFVSKNPEVGKLKPKS
ncbi:MAG TPA: hypothetical protein VKS98_03530 [Chthoniobacterales bacterium]|nr:hypothetical protein [Chthoniobacterales bacterium]